MNFKAQSISAILKVLRTKLMFSLASESARLILLYPVFVIFAVLPLFSLFGLGDLFIVWGCVICIGFLVYAQIRFVFLNLSKIISLRATARWIESVYPFYHGDLISSFEFENKPDLFIDLGFSEQLIRAHIDKVRETVDIKTILNSGSFYPRPQPGRFLIYFTAVLVLPMIVFPDFYADTYYGLYSKYFDPVKPVPETLVVRPGDTKTVFGSTVNIKAVIFSQATDVANIYVRGQNQQWDKFLMKKVSSTLYSYSMKDIKENRQYYVQFGSMKSPVYEIDAITLPIILRHRITYSYPDYTGFRSQSEIRQQFDDITAIKGTKIKFEIFTNNNISSAFFIKGKQSVPFVPKTSDSGYVELKLDAESPYNIKVLDSLGQENEPLKSFNLIPIEDKPPSISIISPSQYSEIPSQMEAAIMYNASDDISLKKAILIFNVSSGEEKSIIIESNINKKTVENTYRWDLTSLQLVPGDEINYKICVYDNCAPPDGPHWAQSKTQVMTFPSMAEIYKRKTEVFDKPQQNLESLKESHDLLISKIKKMEEKLSYAGQLSWADKKSIQEAISQQLNTQQSIDNTAQQLKKDIIDNNISTQILKNYTELQSIMESLMSEQMKQTLRDIQRMLEQTTSFQQMKNKLEISAKDMEKYNENLQRMLNLFKKLSLHNKLTELLEATRQAISEQEKLNKDFSSWQKSKEISHDQVNKELNEIDKFLKYMEDSQKNLASSDPADNELRDQVKLLEQTYETGRMKDLLGMMKQNLSENNPQSAGESGNRMRSAMINYEKVLKALLDKYNSDKININQIVDIINRIERLSREMEQLIISMDTNPGKNTEKNIDHARYMNYIERELNRTGTEAKNLGKQSPIINSAYYDPLFDISQTMERQNENVFKRGDPTASLMIKNELANTRLVAIKWILLLESINRHGQQGGSGNSDMPANMDEFFDQLKKMAEKQSSINDKTSGVPNMMPGSNPMSMQNYLSQLAAEQKMLSQALSKLNKAYPDASKHVLGDLNNMAAEMEKAAQSIKKGDISSELINRQKKILTRLLESEKSVKIREKSDKRESKEGKLNKVAVSPGELDKKLYKVKEDKIKKDGVKSYIPPEYRDIVDKYFQYLIEAK